MVFLLVRAVPGDPCRAMLGERATEAACQAFNEANGLNEPVWVQMGIYLGNLLTGDFGESIRFSRPVSVILMERLPLTIELSIAALSIALIVGIPLGIAAAMRHNTHGRRGDHGGGQCRRVDAGVLAGVDAGLRLRPGLEGHSLRPATLGPARPGCRARCPSTRYGAGNSSRTRSAPMSPFSCPTSMSSTRLVTGQWEVFWDAVQHLILPALALATIPMAIIARITRSSLLEVLGRTTSAPPGPRGPPSGEWSSTTGCATPSCPW